MQTSALNFHILTQEESVGTRGERAEEGRPGVDKGRDSLEVLERGGRQGPEGIQGQRVTRMFPVFI